MNLTTLPVGTISTPTTLDAIPRPPARWSRWSTSPIARVDYAAGSLVRSWHEAWIPADRSITGERLPGVVFGGMSREAAVDAARQLAARTVEARVDAADGRTRTVQLNPAIAVLRDARMGAFWLAPLRTTVRAGGEWTEVPHSIDGAAFEGSEPLLRTPVIRSATREMVAIVGRDTILTPRRWDGAPHDSLLGEG